MENSAHLVKIELSDALKKFQKNLFEILTAWYNNGKRAHRMRRLNYGIKGFPAMRHNGQARQFPKIGMRNIKTAIAAALCAFVYYLAARKHA
jgi:hypothetical protein